MTKLRGGGKTNNAEIMFHGLAYCLIILLAKINFLLSISRVTRHRRAERTGLLSLAVLAETQPERYNPLATSRRRSLVGRHA